MNADPRITLVANRTVAARKQQCRTLHRDRRDIVDTPVQPRPQFEAGVDDGMKYNPSGIGLVGVPGDLPAVAKAANQTLEIGLCAQSACPPARPLNAGRRPPRSRAR